jgi:hypothetical protein
VHEHGGSAEEGGVAEEEEESVALCCLETRVGAGAVEARGQAGVEGHDGHDVLGVGSGYSAEVAHGGAGVAVTVGSEAGVAKGDGVDA